ncbi:restriction endonuclease subunit S [Alysiella crassa]|nr:restriction endonuclease subunit S [Alysiella crassa]
MKTMRLGDIVDFKNGKVFPDNNGDIPIFGGNGVLGYSNQYNYKRCLIIGRVGAYCGSVHYFNEQCWVSDNAIVGIVNNVKADDYYIYYLLKLLNLNKKSIGSSQPLLTQGILDNIQIKIHKDLKIQQSIAKILSQLDQKIALNNQINAQLEQMAKTIYDYWFVQFDFPDENGKPYKSSGGEMVYDEVLKREIPVGWSAKELAHLGEIVGGSTPNTANSENFCENGIAWITPNDLSNNQGNKFIANGEKNISQEGIKDANLKVYPKSTVLMSSRAPIGYMAISLNEVTTNQGFKSFIPNKGYSQYFIFYTIKNMMNKIIKSSSGSTFKEISASVLKQLNFCSPNKNILDNFDEKIKSIFSHQENLEKQNQQLTQLRDFLLPMLMNGQVGVSDELNQ